MRNASRTYRIEGKEFTTKDIIQCYKASTGRNSQHLTIITPRHPSPLWITIFPDPCSTNH